MSAPTASVRAASRLEVVPVSWDDVQRFIHFHHRHHRPPAGHVFRTGVALDGVLVGVASVGRPTARAFQDGRTLEVNRSATDGTRNANSMLYAACWQAAKGLGYRRLVTYTQAGESGSSLRAAGWRVIAQRPPRKGWDTPSRRRSGNGNDDTARTLWEAV